MKHYYNLVLLYSTFVEGGNTNEQEGGTGEGGDTGEKGGNTGEIGGDQDNDDENPIDDPFRYPL